MAQIFPPVPWSLGPKGLIIDINDTESVSRQIYFLLNIKRIFCMRNGEIEGKPLVFPAAQEVTVSDFAGSLGKRMLDGFSRAIVVESDTTMPKGQIVGLDHKLGDGDKVELVGLR